MTETREAPVIVWFRRDLRLHDNIAVGEALASGRPVIAVFILDDDEHRPPGGAARWWLHHSLAALATALADRGGRLILRRGPTRETLLRLVDDTGTTAVFWNRRYEPWSVARDTAIKTALKDRGVNATSCRGSVLAEPWEVATQSGSPFRVYSPFWRAIRSRTQVADIPDAPNRIPSPTQSPESDSLDSWDLCPTAPDWAGGLRAAWQPGEASARDRLAAFLDDGLADYADQRNRPDRAGTSSLSPHLHWGELSPRDIWSAVSRRMESGDLVGRESQAETFLKELVWREFCLHLLYHFPGLPTEPLDDRFDAFPWASDYGADLDAWQRGRTGYPMVDAGMRQLWETGWMHNRVRMVVASFLIKHLLIPWQEGERWFWDTLVDADAGSNTANWQWVAGCGADAAPYFRIFNPILQGEKFDPDGAYVRRWIPELAGMPDRFIHNPWEAPAAVLADAGVIMGQTYPEPIVEHGFARQRALAAFAQIKSGDGGSDDVTARRKGAA